MSAKLFSALTLRAQTFKNRIFVSPMCQYSATAGVPTDWHLVHLGSRAVGGAAAVFVEATAVSPEGRISPSDTGIWNEQQGQAFARISNFIKAQGSVPAIQLAHAGRKASMPAPWVGGKAITPTFGGWEPLSPSALAFSDTFAIPKAMGESDLEKVRQDFVRAAKRSVDAGFQVIEIHAAHGYLLHEFLSPLSNQRTDNYGGSLEKRMAFPLEVVQLLRQALPPGFPLFVRISATDWVDGGWDLDQSVAFCRRLKALGVDLVDCSSGGLVPHAKIPVGPHYQVSFASEIRSAVGIPTGAVGLITDPHAAEGILQNEEADVVFLARELLRQPYWPLHAANSLAEETEIPVQYGRAFESRK